jgi:hypothetical protein
MWHATSLQIYEYRAKSQKTVVFAKMLPNRALRLVSEAEAIGLKERSPLG